MTHEDKVVNAVHTMKMYWGVQVYLHPLLNSALDGGEWLIVSSQYLLNRRLAVPQSWSVHFGQQDNLLSLLAIKPSLLGHPTHSLHTTLTMLSSKIDLTFIKSNRIEMPVFDKVPSSAMSDGTGEINDRMFLCFAPCCVGILYTDTCR